MLPKSHLRKDGPRAWPPKWAGEARGVEPGTLEPSLPSRGIESGTGKVMPVAWGHGLKVEMKEGECVVNATGKKGLTLQEKKHSASQIGPQKGDLGGEGGHFSGKTLLTFLRSVRSPAILVSP